ncbi:MAG: hemolysin activation protein [Bacteroidaceae bacterium]|nr:hemolysin activation protein [Bacteroidaceae bacterium]
MSNQNSEDVDISVLILFFNRPRHLAQVFQAVRKAQPARLFLYQDGPRNDADLPQLEACRAVVADIDWPCEVHRNYQTQNAGCDPSGFRAHTWAFSLTDKCIVLEDDVVPCPTFFPFCQEMLDRYEHDERVGMITGFNHDEVTTDVSADYFFTSNLAIWGWASWARVVNRWEGDYAFWRDDESRRLMQNLIADRRLRSEYPRIVSDHAASGKEYFESIFLAAMLMGNRLAIVPRANMITNVGADPDSTHFASDAETMPARLRRIFTMGTHDLEFPLSHPRYVVDHVAFTRRVYDVNAWDRPWRKVQYSLEELWNNLRRGRFSVIARAVRKRVEKTVRKGQYK